MLEDLQQIKLISTEMIIAMYTVYKHQSQNKETDRLFLIPTVTIDNHQNQ